jgi:hypothetical protein
MAELLDCRSFFLRKREFNMRRRAKNPPDQFMSALMILLPQDKKAMPEEAVQDALRSALNLRGSRRTTRGFEVRDDDKSEQFKFSEAEFSG